MADITSYQNLFYGQIETPTAPNPRLASAISESDTDLIFTNSIKDEDGNVPDKALIIGIKEAISGYIESVYIPKYIMSGDITSGSVAVINIADTSKLAVGMRVIGTGIQANTTILAIDSSTQITLNQSATATATESLTFLSLSGDGLKAYGVVRGIARSGVNGIDFDTSVSANRVAHAEGDQVRVNISALLFEMINQVTSGQISNGQSTFRVGDGTDVDVYFYINNGDANEPFLRYVSATNSWVYSEDGVNELPMGGVGSLIGSYINISGGAVNLDTDTIRTSVSTNIPNMNIDPITGAITRSTSAGISSWIFTGVGGDGSDGALTITSGTTNIATNTKKNYTSVSITGTGILSTTDTTWGVLDIHSQGNVSITGGGSININAKVTTHPSTLAYHNGIENINYIWQPANNGAGGNGGNISNVAPVTPYIIVPYTLGDLGQQVITLELEQ